MKNIYKKIKLSPFFLLVILLSLVSGLFKDVITLFMIIIIHELGHILSSIMLNWKIRKIDITICGGFITYDDVIDKPFKEEIIIAVSGFLFQFILYVFSFLLYKLNILDIKFFSLINRYNLSIFLFNILPIYPLDGAKILLVIYNFFMPYKKSLRLISITSIAFLFLIILYFIKYKIKFEYSYIMIMCFILFKIINLIEDIPYLFNKLLFERYLYGIKVKDYKYINGDDISLFTRRKKHYFLIGKHYYDEKYILSKKFD